MQAMNLHFIDLSVGFPKLSQIVLEVSVRLDPGVTPLSRAKSIDGFKPIS
jgi:hypothetical protein